MMVKVAGFCPMGCGETLFVVNARDMRARVECCHEGCARPTAVDELLADVETDHIVEFGADGFSVQHPLAERLDGDLFTCTLHEQLGALDGPPAAPGRYRVTSPLGGPLDGLRPDPPAGEDTGSGGSR